jgi:hypothetical protein
MNPFVSATGASGMFGILAIAGGLGFGSEIRNALRNGFLYNRDWSKIYQAKQPIRFRIQFWIRFSLSVLLLMLGASMIALTIYEWNTL